jgi:RNA polymerase sigma-70 factor (ECF subfamily)
MDIQEAEVYEKSPRLQDMETPETNLLNQEIVATIKMAIEGLPKEMRIAIMLCEFDNLSYEEIARVMNCPVGTVRSRIFRAREAIDRVLAPLLTNGDVNE